MQLSIQREGCIAVLAINLQQLAGQQFCVPEQARRTAAGPREPVAVRERSIVPNSAAAPDRGKDTSWREVKRRQPVLGWALNIKPTMKEGWLVILEYNSS